MTSTPKHPTLYALWVYSLYKAHNDRARLGGNVRAMYAKHITSGPHMGNYSHSTQYYAHVLFQHFSVAEFSKT